MIISLFDRLPDTLVYCLLVEWLGVREVGRLDSAFSVQPYRATLLHLFTQMDWRPVFGTGFALQAAANYSKVLKWLLIRDLRTTQVYFSGCGDDQTTSLTMQVIARDGNEINRLVLQDIIKEDDFIFQCIADNCTGLTGLQCSMAAAPPSFGDVLLRNPGLFELLLRTFASKELEDTLRVVHCPSLTRFYYLQKVPLDLANLIVGAFPNLSDVSFDAIDADALQVIAALPVQFLILRDIQHTGEYAPDFEWKEEMFSALQELDIHQWYDIVPIACILARSPRLHTVKLNNTSQLPNNCGEAILQRLAEHLGPQLRILELDAVHGLRDAGLRLVAERCTNLNIFIATYCYNDFAEDTVIELLKRCTKLTSLYLHDLKCTPAVVQAASTHNPNVQLLNLLYNT